MTVPQPPAALIGAVGLLERAVGYALGSLHGVTMDDLGLATPCRGWDLGDLLRHLDDSLRALTDALGTGVVGLRPDPSEGADPVVTVRQDRPEGVDPLVTVRQRATRLLGACAAPRAGELVLVAGCPVTASIVAAAGAIEVAVHGWDVARTGGHHRPIPPSLAAEMLDLSRMLVTPADRPARFASPVAVRSAASAEERLVAYLGRDPY